MGHRDAGYRAGLLALSAVAAAGLLGSVPAQPAGAAASGDPQPPPDPAAEPADDTLLPPAEEDSVLVVPVDEPRDQPADDLEDPNPAARPGLLHLRDVDTTAAVGWGLLAFLSLAATWIAATRLARMLHVWRSPASVRASSLGPAAATPATSFSLLVPAGPESPHLPKLRSTLDQLTTLDHPAYEVLVVVPHDDLASRGAALAAAAHHSDRLRVVFIDDPRRSRAARLNTALAECQGEVVGVFEPGDDVHPELLRHVDASVVGRGADAVQAGVQLFEETPRWFSLRRIVDRYFWYRSRLPFHAQQRFTPLDVSTVFIRADVLRAAGGWHEHCVDEGCDLGVRLSVEGARIVVGYEQDLATRTPAPGTVRALVRQEARWIRGFLQVLRMGVWRRLPSRRQRLLARAMLVRPLVEAIVGVASTAAVVGVLATAVPPLVAALALLPAIPALMILGVEVAGLAELERFHGQRIQPREQVIFVLSTVPYQLLVGIAALIAVLLELGTLSRRRRIVPVAPAAPSRLEPLDSDEVAEAGVTGGQDTEEPKTGAQVIDVSNGQQPATKNAELRASTRR